MRGTADRQGHCDSSIRVGKPGFLKVIDPSRIAYPEYRGNGVYASLGNIAENPHIGLLMIDFYKTTLGLHINGTATIMEQIDGLDDPRAERWGSVEVEEAYIQCSKHIPLMERQHKPIHWNTDDETFKGGDFFEIGKPNKAPHTEPLAPPHSTAQSATCVYRRPT
jgi:predicted pyridoxine 5'-phosphate oxidase superfamily flavin-nucleotide-binding protein